MGSNGAWPLRPLCWTARPRASCKLWAVRTRQDCALHPDLAGAASRQARGADYHLRASCDGDNISGTGPLGRFAAGQDPDRQGAREKGALVSAGHKRASSSAATDSPLPYLAAQHHHHHRHNRPDQPRAKRAQVKGCPVPTAWWPRVPQVPQVSRPPQAPHPPRGKKTNKVRPDPNSRPSFPPDSLSPLSPHPHSKPHLLLLPTRTLLDLICSIPRPDRPDNKPIHHLYRAFPWSRSNARILIFPGFFFPPVFGFQRYPTSPTATTTTQPQWPRRTSPSRSPRRRPRPPSPTLSKPLRLLLSPRSRPRRLPLPVCVPTNSFVCYTSADLQVLRDECSRRNQRQLRTDG